MLHDTISVGGTQGLGRIAPVKGLEPCRGNPVQGRMYHIHTHIKRECTKNTGTVSTKTVSTYTRDGTTQRIKNISQRLCYTCLAHF